MVISQSSFQACRGAASLGAGALGPLPPAAADWPADVLGLAGEVRLDRFLVLGSEGGTYYIQERELTSQNAEAVARCIADDGPRTVARIVEISEAGRMSQ